MFKSIFSRYLTTVMVIVMASIVLSTSVITILVNVYDGNTKTRTLANVAEKTAVHLIDEYERSDAETFARFLSSSGTQLDLYLDFVGANFDEVVVFICNYGGAVKYVGGCDRSKDFTRGDGHTPLPGLVLPDNVLDKLEGKESLELNDVIDGFFIEKHRTYIIPLRLEDGTSVGSIMTSSMTNDMDNLTSAMVRTITISCLWLMLAALLAVYFITEKMVSPIRAISRAAREFAAGHFDVRVAVSGDDEISELAESFNNMASTLQRSEETRRMFLANVSHDLRTPMTTVSGFIDSILSGAIPNDQIPHYLEVISSEIRRLSRLVSTLLDITKIQAGERKFTMAAFDICETAREIIISSEQRLCERELDVQFDADRDNMFVDGDRDAIHQVLYNLCDNAIKFASTGGKFIVSVHDAGSKTEVSVYNEGEGISPEDIPFVFDRFYKSDRSRGLDKTGAGLGLYISRTIIEAHKERIYVESERGKWCRFTFTLPKRDVPKLKDERRNGDNIK